jgi:cystathionine beta-lyase/cystathionine gamma-synthase
VAPRISEATPIKEDRKQQHRRDRGKAGGRPLSFAPDPYRERNTVERSFNKLKIFRAAPSLMTVSAPLMVVAQWTACRRRSLGPDTGL